MALSLAITAGLALGDIAVMTAAQAAALPAAEMNAFAAASLAALCNLWIGSGAGSGLQMQFAVNIGTMANVGVTPRRTRTPCRRVSRAAS